VITCFHQGADKLTIPLMMPVDLWIIKQFWNKFHPRLKYRNLNLLEGNLLYITIKLTLPTSKKRHCICAGYTKL